MSRIQALRGLVERHVSRRSRRRRFERFLQLMRPAATEIVLDVGAASGSSWGVFVPRAARGGWRVLICDLDPEMKPAEAVDGAVFANALALPFASKSVDVVFSNSVLEHVGPLPAQRQYANEIRRVGRRYFIEAPNKHFPIEPHWYIPFLQYLPARWQVRLTQCLFGEQEEIHLPNHRLLQALFPGAHIERERLLGLTKAYYVWDD